MNTRNQSPEDLNLPKGQKIDEITHYLVEHLNDEVNGTAEIFLQDAQYNFVIEGYRPFFEDKFTDPNMPSGIVELEETLLREHAPVIGADFTGMDIRVNFPIKTSESDNPLHVELNWSNGSQIVLSLVDKRPVLLVQRINPNKKDAEPLYSAQVHPEIMAHYFETIGIPQELSGTTVEPLLSEVSSARSVQIIRARESFVDTGTNLTIEHTARLAKDFDDNMDVVQELCLNVDHLETREYLSDKGQFGPAPRYRTLLRFARNDDEKGWVYQGTYTGLLKSGELKDELVQDDPKLGIASDAVMDKVLKFLTELPTVKRP